MDISIFTIEYLPIILMIFIFWTFSSLLYHYILCHFFKKYDKVSFLLTIINPIITIFNGVYAQYIYYNNIDPLFYENNNDPLLNENNKNFKINNDINSYISVILYPPGSIFIVLLKYFTSIVASFFIKHIDNLNTTLTTEEAQESLSENDKKKLKS